MTVTTRRPRRSQRSHIAPVTTREELIYLLSRASELEHGLACIYLFASFSLKNDVSEGGLTGTQAEMVRRWKRRLSAVAVEEMLHLAQVSNMLTAIGGAPHFKRANLPMSPNAFPFGIRLSLEPFSRETIERFVCFEMPEAGILTPSQEAVYAQMRARIIASDGGRSPGGAEGGAPISLGSDARAAISEPFEIDFKTVGEFYHKIATGFLNIHAHELFIGPREAQANARYVDLAGELVAVVDRASACSAIDMIIEQGEAPSAAHPDAHFVVFDTIRTEYTREVESALEHGEVFDPVRSVVSNPMTRYYDDTSGGTIITDETTHEVAELFNISYDTMLLMLLRFFSHTDETEPELEQVSRATLRLMTTVLRPLGEALVKMPVGFDSKTAGPGFGYNRDVHLLPHKASAWVFFAERLRDLAVAAARVRAHAGLPTEVGEAAAALEDLATQFAPTDRAWNADAELQQLARIDANSTCAIRPELNGPYLVTSVERLANSKGEPLPARPRMALCRCGGSGNKPFCDGTHARIGFSSAKSPDRVADHRDAYTREDLTVFDNRGICQHSGLCSDALASVFRTNAEPFIDMSEADQAAIIDAVRKCPSGALSYAIDSVEHRDQEREPTITVSKDGPYRITGCIQIPDEPRAEGASTEHYALCRCGGSKNKPFCDGTHWYNKFHDDKN
jgi:CDGSH-type Zn-finger protein